MLVELGHKDGKCSNLYKKPKITSHMLNNLECLGSLWMMFLKLFSRFENLSFFVYQFILVSFMQTVLLQLLYFTAVHFLTPSGFYLNFPLSGAAFAPLWAADSRLWLNLLHYVKTMIWLLQRKSFDVGRLCKHMRCHFIKLHSNNQGFLACNRIIKSGLIFKATISLIEKEKLG